MSTDIVGPSAELSCYVLIAGTSHFPPWTIAQQIHMIALQQIASTDRCPGNIDQGIQIWYRRSPHVTTYENGFDRFHTVLVYFLGE
jgi:hypothetical protein